jgi:coenzyme F420 hydrogenase subunit beta
MNNVSDVIKENLCTGCGTCIGLCPTAALTLNLDHKKGIYTPKFNAAKCINCSICYNSCPGHSFDFKKFNLDLYNKDAEDALIGNYLNCYLGHSNDSLIHDTSSSGGLVTQLLIYYLEKGLIDGALVSRMNKNNPLEPEAFIARTKQEIISASKSKYCPVPVNIVLKEILNSEPHEKFAVVGLPCHIQGLRKAEQLNKNLSNKIPLHIGIFCGHTPTLLGTEFILNKVLNVEKDNVKNFAYRGDGWPSGISVTLNNNTKMHLPHHFLWGNIFSQYFYPFRCTLCYDQTCEFADISFGDAWLPEIMEKDNKKGCSIMVARTEFGNNLLKEMNKSEIITMHETTSNKVRQSQYGFQLRKNLKTRLKFCSFFGHKTPIYSKRLLNPSKYYIVKCIWFYFDIYISSKKSMWGFLKYYIRARTVAGSVIQKIKNRKLIAQ